MKPATCEHAVLRQLAFTPFCDRIDLAELCGWSPRAVHAAAGRLQAAGFAASIPHATTLTAPARRFHLTPAGVRRLAREEGVTLDEVLRSYPLSAHWRRLLLQRLDALATIQRLAAALSSIAYPLRIGWYRASSLDATFVLPGGGSIGIVRQGRASDRTGFSKRLRRLHEGPLPGAILLLFPDETRLLRARRLLGGAPLPAFLTIESEVAAADPRSRIWRFPSLAGRLALEELPPLVGRRGVAPVETRPVHAILPNDGVPEEQLASSLLMPAEKVALDALFDWPWITLKDLAGLLAVSIQRASQLVLRLERLDLAARVLVAGRRRLVLRDRGLDTIARRDRISVGAMRKRWSTGPLDQAAPLDWRNVSGTRSRQLLRHLEHTEAVHRFNASLAGQARDLGWEVVQLDPPQRASRYFRRRERLHSIRPDAFGLLRRHGSAWSFFLEWERRAVRPVTMAARLAPYLRYFSSERPPEDRGTGPAVLVVFDDELAATHFLRVARAEMDRVDVEVPLRVSHRAAVEEMGPLDRATWRTAESGSAAQPSTP